MIVMGRVRIYNKVEVAYIRALNTREFHCLLVHKGLISVAVYVNTFKPIIRSVIDFYQPSCIVLQVSNDNRKVNPSCYFGGICS